MSIYVIGLNAEIFQHIKAECPRMFTGVIEEDGVVNAYLNEYVIFKTSLNEVKLELGLHTYYLEATDFVKVEIC